MSDKFYVIANPLLAVLIAVGVYFNDYSHAFLTFLILLMFALGLTTKTKGERLISDKLDQMKKELDDLL